MVRANVAGDADLVGFGQLGHTAINQLLISPTSGVTSLADLEGKTVGIKGDLPVAIEAMMAAEGLQRGTFTELLLEGFNPVEHFALGIDALPRLPLERAALARPGGHRLHHVRPAGL